MFGRLMVMERDLSNRAVGGSLGYGHHYRYICYGRHYRYISHSFSSHSCSCFVYSGSIYTFISRMFVDRIGVAIDDLGYDLIVSTPTIAVLAIGVCMRDIGIVTQQCILSTDFTVLVAREFDDIFGMD